MTDKLSHLGDTSVEELKQISVAVQQYVSTENEVALQTALDKINQKPQLIARLFPSALEKENNAPFCKECDQWVQRMKKCLNSTHKFSLKSQENKVMP